MGPMPTKSPPAPAKRARKAVAPPAPTAVKSPEVLIRLAFKEADLRTIMEALDDTDPKLAPIIFRLRKRMAEHELARL